MHGGIFQLCDNHVDNLRGSVPAGDNHVGNRRGVRSRLVITSRPTDGGGNVDREILRSGRRKDGRFFNEEIRKKSPTGGEG